MPSCEKCWSRSRFADDSIEEYHRLIVEMKCTPEEQAGPDATYCESCDRKTRHQDCRMCMACGDNPADVAGHASVAGGGR